MIVDVAPEACLLRHPPNDVSVLVAIPTLRNLRALQHVHQRDQFLHRQFAVGPNHDRDVRIRLLQRRQSRAQRLRVHRLHC